MTELARALHPIAREILEARRVPEDGAPQLDLTFALVARGLSEMVGELGYEALAQRAVHLAAVRAPELAPAAAGPRFPEQGWRELTLQLGAERAHDCAVVLLDELLCLFAEFVGRELTLRLLARAFPELEFGVLPQGRVP